MSSSAETAAGISSPPTNNATMKPAPSVKQNSKSAETAAGNSSPPANNATMKPASSIKQNSKSQNSDNTGSFEVVSDYSESPPPLPPSITPLPLSITPLPPSVFSIVDKLQGTVLL